MIKWLAHRRFNYIDSWTSFVSAYLVGTSHWLFAIILFVAGCFVSLIIEERAKK